MRTREKQLEILVRMCLAEGEGEREYLREELRRMISGENDSSILHDPEAITRKVLLELGAPDHLVGHCYMVEAILLVVENRSYINNITFGLYPQIAAKFDTTAARVERSMRHLVVVTWTRGDIDVLIKYFGNTISMARGKPTNAEFIARLANVVKQELKLAA